MKRGPKRTPNATIEGSDPGAIGILLSGRHVVLVDRDDYRLVADRRWRLSARGYAESETDGMKVRMHRVLMPDASQVDHRNGNKLDNRRANLRPATTKQNNANRPKRPGTRGRFKGAYRHKKGWKACISVNGKVVHIGCFKTEEDAARAYDAAAIIQFGEFANLNFPRE